MKRKIQYASIIALALILAASCGTNRKLSRLSRPDSRQVALTLAKEQDFIPNVDKSSQIARDTLIITDEDGRELIIMKAVRDDETGEMVASEIIDAASITARFRNVAERNGKVDLAFMITVPSSMMDSKWQLRFYPDMFVMADSIRLDPVLLTGEAYRKAQLRGYEMYDRFLSRIVEDTTKFINIRLLEVFLKRYIPEVYAFKTDSSLVSQQQFYTAYGVSQRQAVEHYTKQHAKKMNDRRKSKKDKMYKKYIKAPIVTEGIRLDSVVINSKGDFVYNYVQTINTRPKLRKVDIVLSGDIFEEDRKIYDIPRSQPLTFYISSISGLTDNKEKYLTKVIERRVTANTESRIDFEVGKYEIKPEFRDNMYEIRLTEKTLASLVENTTFDLDSIVVSATASPDGPLSVNSRLAQQRSESVSGYFSRYVKELRDSIRSARGIVTNLDNTYSSASEVDIDFTPRCIPENWQGLDYYVENDPVMNFAQKEDYFRLAREKNPDIREQKLRTKPYYSYVKEALYPRLRTVKFNFYLHRKGMVKDTVHTTVIDSTYMRGVEALKNMDYATALTLLRPYSDYNTAIAYLGMDRNANAKKILLSMEKTPEVNYLLAIVYSRTGNFEKAVESYLKACGQNQSYRFRGHLDPEISVLIKKYELTSEENNKIFY